jgi:hypothetical protein
VWRGAVGGDEIGHRHQRVGHVAMQVLAARDLRAGRQVVADGGEQVGLGIVEVLHAHRPVHVVVEGVDRPGENESAEDLLLHLFVVGPHHHAAGHGAEVREGHGLHAGEIGAGEERVASKHLRAAGGGEVGGGGTQRREGAAFDVQAGDGEAHGVPQRSAASRAARAARTLAGSAVLISYSRPRV